MILRDYSRKFRRLACPVLLLPSFYLGSSACAATLTVNSLGDDTNSGDGLVTLREAIQAAVGDSTTDLGQTGTANDLLDLSSLAGTITLTSDLPAINTGITLNGSGAGQLTVDGAGAYTFLTLGSAATVSLQGVTVANCYRSSNGGAISNSGSLTATDCVFHANRSSVINNLNAMGSAIYGSGTGSSIQLTDCVFSENVGEMVSSGGFFFAGSAVGSGGTVLAARCTFERNSTLLSGTPSGGGGMGNSVGGLNGATITLTDCTIRDGYFQQPTTGSYTSWGSVYIGFNSHLSAEGCTWTGNVGNPVVGIYTITSNVQLNNLQLVNCTFAENGDSESGAMIYCYPNSLVNLTIEHCTFADNQNRNSLPAALYGVMSGVTPQVQLINSVLASTDASVGRKEIQDGFPFTSNGHNFISNPGTSVPSQPDLTYASTSLSTIRELLNPLDDNGGPVATCSLPDGSPLIDGGDPSGFAPLDQRDVTRPRDGDTSGSAAPDIGAYERFNGNLRVEKTVDRSQAAEGATLVYTLSVTNDHPTEPAADVIVTDVLPPNLQVVSTTPSTFTSVESANGTITARRTSLPVGETASVTITCAVNSYMMVNTASARQKGFEVLPANNSSSASTGLVTPPAPRVTEFVGLVADPTSATEAAFRLAFDRPVSGLDSGDLQLLPGSPAGAVSQVTTTDGGSSYEVTISGLSGSGPLALLLSDDDSIRSSDEVPLGGFSGDGSTTSTLLTVDQVAPQSAPVAAAGSLGGPVSTVFHLLFTATDDLAGVAGVDLYFRKGTAGAFIRLADGPFSGGFAPFDTALHGGHGTYEFYTVAVDKAGNAENKPLVPEIGVTFGTTAPTGVLGWELYQ